jgi:hypothetical protein
MGTTIDEITVADEPDAWRAAGFAVDETGECRIGHVRIRLVGRGAGKRILGWSLIGLELAGDQLAGDQWRRLTSSARPQPSSPSASARAAPATATRTGRRCGSASSASAR